MPGRRRADERHTQACQRLAWARPDPDADQPSQLDSLIETGRIAALGLKAHARASARPAVEPASTEDLLAIHGLFDRPLRSCAASEVDACLFRFGRSWINPLEGDPRAERVAAPPSNVREILA